MILRNNKKIYLQTVYGDELASIISSAFSKGQLINPGMNSFMSNLNNEESNWFETNTV